jgi:hypothetical protein
MARGMKTGGRKAGTPNRRTSQLAAMLADAVGEDFDPVVKLAQIACHPDTPIDLQVRCLDSIAPYVRPRLKNSEISGPDGGALQFEVVSAIGIDSERSMNTDHRRETGRDTDGQCIDLIEHVPPLKGGVGAVGEPSQPSTKWRPRQNAAFRLIGGLQSDYEVEE